MTEHLGDTIEVAWWVRDPDDRVWDECCLRLQMSLQDAECFARVLFANGATRVKVGDDMRCRSNLERVLAPE